MSDRPEFASWRSFVGFRQEVVSKRRFRLSSESQAFLDTLAETAKNRARRLAAKKRLFRAQVAHHDIEDPDAGAIRTTPKCDGRYTLGTSQELFSVRSRTAASRSAN